MRTAFPVGSTCLPLASSKCSTHHTHRSVNIEETDLKPEAQNIGQNKAVPSRKSVNINIEMPSSDKQRTRVKEWQYLKMRNNRNLFRQVFYCPHSTINFLQLALTI
jgi:hypothetical protein